MAIAAPTPARSRTDDPGWAGGARRRWPLAATAQREIAVVLLLLCWYGLFVQVPLWNENSRYDLIVAIAEDRTLRIDRLHRNTGDKALVDGHYYSDKLPGTAFLGLPVYWMIDRIVPQTGGGPAPTAWIIAVLTFVLCGLPTIAMVILLLRFLRPLVGEPWALTLALGYGLGTIAFPFATMLFGHATSTAALFAAFYVLARRDPAGRPLPLVGAGFLVGWAVLVDLPTLFAVGALLVYAWSRSRRAPLWICLGAVPPALLLLGYNWLAFGAPFSLGYANLANQGFAGAMGRGLLGVTRPRLDALIDLLVAPRGLLRLSPWLALAPLGLLAARRSEVRREVALCATIVVAALLLNAGYFLPFGGRTPGPRFLLLALPFATILVALAPAIVRLLVGLQIAVSFALCLIATATVPNAPEGVEDPLRDLWLPRFLAGDLAQTTAALRWGWSGWLPLLPLGLALGLALLTAYATTRQARWARRVVGVGFGLLALLALACGPPIELLGRR